MTSAIREWEKHVAEREKAERAERRRVEEVCDGPLAEAYHVDPVVHQWMRYYFHGDLTYVQALEKIIETLLTQKAAMMLEKVRTLEQR